MRTPAFITLAAVLALGVVSCGDGVELDSSDGASSSTPSKTKPLPPVSKIKVLRGGEALAGPGGGRFPVDPKLITGYIDNAVLNGKYIDMSGWAAPADLSAPADWAVAATKTKAVAIVAPSGDRPDLVEGYDRPGLKKAGFAMSVPKSALDCSAPNQGLTTYGVAGDAAGPLKWLADVPKVVASAC